MHTESNSLKDIDWNESFGKYIKRSKLKLFSKDNTEFLFNKLKEQYNLILAKEASEVPLIPKIIHQIVLDKENIPQHCQYYLETMKILHPDFEYKLWTIDQALELCSIELSQAIKTLEPVLQIDYLKYIILKEFGGIYISLGVKCFKSLEYLNYKCNFFASLNPPQKFHKIEVLGSIIGVSKDNSIINEILEKITLSTKLKNFDNILSDVIKNRLIENTLDQALILSPIFLNPINEDIETKENTIKGSKLIKNELMQPFNRINERSLVCNIGFDKYSFIRAFDFSLLCGVGHIKEAESYVKHRDDIKIFENFKQTYIKLHPAKVAFSGEVRIPNEIHLINANIETQQRLENIFNNWKIKNWSLTELRLRLKKRGLSTIEDPIIEKFIMSLLILFEKGGVFIDNDYIPIKDITDFTYQYDFFAGLLPPGKKRLGVGQDIIGASLRNPIIEQTLDYLFDNFDYLNHIDSNNLFAYLISKAGLNNKNIVFPPVFLYPISKYKLTKNLRSRIVSRIYGEEYVIDFTKLLPESHFIHKNYVD
ncbi:MAG: hypothetical protein K0R02_446 [Rickettsiaceae bacterium]|jgi:hypothetical protein|nr:hypothetical protein [Rickettsiaceae bacterium]